MNLICQKEKFCVKMFIKLLFLLNGFIIYYLWKKFKKTVSQADNIFFKKYSDVPLKSKENKVHKQVFEKSKVDGKKIDVIIIGSGASGLSVGSIMSKRGKKVLVLEQCKKAGGFTHTFKEKGYEFCSGVHYLPYIRPNGFMEKLYDLVSDGKLKMVSFGEQFDEIKIGEKSYQIYQGEKYEEYLCSEFPDEAKQIKFFLKECGKVLKDQPQIMKLRMVPGWLRKILIRFGNAKTFLKYQKKTIGELVEEMFKNDDLKAIFSYMYMLIGDYAHSPASMVMSAISSYNKGAFYPKGGCSQIAKTICAVIEKNGGQVLCRAFVDKILIENETAVGVRMKSGYEIRAKQVISCAGVHNTFNNMLPKKFHLKKGDYEPSPAGVYVYCGFKASAQSMDFPEANVIAFDNLKQLKGEIWMKEEPKEDSEPSPFIFAGMVHNLHPHPDPNRCSVIIMTQCDYKWVEAWKDEPTKNRGSEYDNIKNIMQDKILERFFKLYPKARDNLDYVDTASPVSVTHWCNFKWGESYGNLNTVNNLFDNFTSPEVKGIKNLFLTGIDIFFVCGVNSAVLSGMLTAQFALKEDLVSQAAQKLKHDRKQK